MHRNQGKSQTIPFGKLMCTNNRLSGFPGISMYNLLCISGKFTEKTTSRAEFSTLLLFKTGNSLKEIPFGTMSLNDYLQLIRKTELENKPVAKLTVKEFFELSSLTFVEN